MPKPSVTPIFPVTVIFPPLAFKTKFRAFPESELIDELKLIVPLLALVLIVTVAAASSVAPSISTLLPVVLEVVILPPRITFVLPSSLTDLISSALPITAAVTVAPSISTVSYTHLTLPTNREV